MHCFVLPKDLTVGCGVFEIFHLTIVVKDLAHENRIFLLLILERAELLVHHAHHSPIVVILIDLQGKNSQCLLTLTRRYLRNFTRLRTGIELNLHEAAYAVDDAIFGLSVAREHTIPQVCDGADDAAFSKDRLAHDAEQCGQLCLLGHSADHYHFVEWHD